MPETNDEIVARFASNLYSRDKQIATVESYCRDASEFLRYLHQFKRPINAVEPETLLAFRDHLLFESQDKENSVRRKIIGVRQFFRFLAAEKLIGASPFDEMPLPERDEGMKRTLSSKKISTIVSGLHGKGLKASRDLAIIHLLAHEGLKAGELIELQWRDFIATQGKSTLFIRGTKDRSIFLFPDTASAIKTYRAAFDEWAAPLAAEHRQEFRKMFVSFKGKDGSLVSPSLTRHGLKFSLYEIGERFQVPYLNTESLRHYTIENLLSEGWDGEAIMQHLGLRRLGNIAKHMAQRKRGEQ